MTAAQIRWRLLAAAILFAGLAPAAEAQSAAQRKCSVPLPGLALCRYPIGASSALVSSEVVLLKINLAEFTLQLGLARDLGAQRADIKSITRKLGGIAGINASFFDTNGSPLGLIVRDSQQLQKLQSGGNLLTGVFMIKDGRAQIVHRDSYSPQGVTVAVQAGPRLIENGRPLNVSSDSQSTRRSGIAVTDSGQVVLYATVLRFPGASLVDIQRILLSPELAITDALNFDGGGSSQLIIEELADSSPEISITGGDNVPVGIVIKAKRSGRGLPPTEKADRSLRTKDSGVPLRKTSSKTGNS